MDTRDLWEDQVNRLTKQFAVLIGEMKNFEQRVTYLEGVVITLLVALKEGGVIIDSDENSDENTYDLTEN